MNIKKNIFTAQIVWLVLVAVSLSWNLMDSHKEQKDLAIQTARSFFDQIVLTRLWNAQHGGVYVPVTENTRPNPYLNDARRDITVGEDLVLTKINPAFMTRQISEITRNRENVHFHITSLNPIRPGNDPTEREMVALKQFEKGIPEVGTVIRNDTGKSFFYMAPLITRKACLDCHAQQGYQAGDIRGGISVTLPFVMSIPLIPMILGHLVLGIAGFLGIAFFGRRLNQAYATIARQGVEDELTGIPNRRLFNQEMKREFKRSQREKSPLSLILCDIDNFKAYNDLYGHPEGDQCLKTTARTIESTLRRPADFCARLGGEEFVIILPNTPLQGAEFIARNILYNIQQLKIPNRDSATGIVTLSLGVVCDSKQKMATHEELLKAADRALYQAKSQGKNRIVAISLNKDR
jgi:diguanylate cyclase (GGDEF)-like protein